MLPARANMTNHFVVFLKPVTGCFWCFKQTPGSLLRCKSRSGLLKHEISLPKELSSRNLGDVKHLTTGYRHKQKHNSYYWRRLTKLRLKRIAFGFFSRTRHWLCFPACKGIQQVLKFRIPRCGFWIPGTGFRIHGQWNLDSGFRSLVGFRIPIVIGIPDPDRYWDSGFRIPGVNGIPDSDR